MRRAEAVIVGGGWTGLLTASFLASRGMQPTLLTESLPGDSVLPATLHRPDVYRRIAAWHGERLLRMHLAGSQRLMTRLPEWLAPLAHYRDAELYVYAQQPSEIPFLRGQLDLLQQLGLPAEFAPDAGGCPFPVELSYRSPALLIDSQQLVEALCRDIQRDGGCIHTGSQVVNANARQVFTAEGRVEAPLVLLCTGKPLGLTGRLLALLETRTHTCRRMKPPVPLHTVQTAIQPGGLTLQPANGAVEAHWDAGRTGAREEAERTALFGRILRRRMPEWDAAPPEYRLQAHALDGLPLVGSLKAGHGRILFAAGAEDFIGAMISAQALARLALRTPCKADLLLRPDRPLPRRMLRQAVLRLRRHRAVNALRRLAPRCSHCRCRLRYHAAARWWGCPACGSAYGMLGQRMGGPSLHDAAIHAIQRPDW